MPEWFTPFALVLDALAVFRLTRLVTRDSLPPLPWLRDRVTDRWGDRAVADLAVCPWCLSWWVAVVVLALHAVAPTWWPWVAAALACSAVAGLLADWEGRDG